MKYRINPILIIAGIFFLAVIVCLMIFSNKKRFVIAGIVLVIVLILGISYIDFDEVTENFSGLNIDNSSKINNLRLVKSNNENILMSDDNIIDFIMPLRKYNVVYLKDIGYYYAVIFSVKKDFYEKDFFYGNEVKRRNKDVLAFFEKSTGRYINYTDRPWEVSGEKIMLNNMISTENSVAFALTASYEKEPKRIMTLFINITDFEERPDRITTDTIIFKTETNYVYLKGFYIDKYNSILLIDNEKDFVYKERNVVFNGPNVSISSSYNNELLEEEVYLKEGYVKMHDDEIYFLGLDNSIYKIHINNKIKVSGGKKYTTDTFYTYFKWF